MQHLWYAKFCMILTFGFAGLNLHQLLSSYRHVSNKIKEFKALVAEMGSQSSLNFFEMVFYLVIPGLYIFFLSKTSLSGTWLFIIALKFLLTATYGMWVQRKILADWQYTKPLYLIGKFDNFLNIAVSFLVGYWLIFPQ